jgi:hypothetical protein
MLLNTTVINKSWKVRYALAVDVLPRQGLITPITHWNSLSISWAALRTEACIATQRVESSDESLSAGIR